jgi:hypothetical protein
MLKLNTISVSMSIAYANCEFQFYILRHVANLFGDLNYKKHQGMFIPKSLPKLVSRALFDRSFHCSADSGRREEEQAEHGEQRGAAGPAGGGRLAHVAQRRVAALGARVQLGALADDDAARLALVGAVSLQRPHFRNGHHLADAGRVQYPLHLHLQQTQKCSNENQTVTHK